MYRSLDAKKIIETLVTLQHRIAERFPQASLGGVAAELVTIAKQSAKRIRSIDRPNLPLRLAVIALLGAFGFVVWKTASQMQLRVDVGETSSAVQLLDALEKVLNNLVYAGVAIWFLFGLEGRMKRRRALNAIHEIRALAHVVDMHQLTKDPESVLAPGKGTASSPKREMSAFELSRYLDYCSEMLSLMGKIAALYVQDFKDPVALSAVDDVESLTNGLSRKIWQKITLIPR